MPKTVILDIGGVLVKLGGMRQFVEWTGLTPTEIKSRWLGSTTVRDFESGRLSFGRFAAAVIHDFDLPIRPGHLREEMRSWTGELFDGAEDLLSELAGKHSLVWVLRST